jgi:dihydrofolate reductase
MFKGYWPGVIKEGDEKVFADKFNGLSKIVFSTTLDRAPWGTWPEARVVHRSPSEEVAELKERPGKHMFLSGSPSIVQPLLRANLIDELRLVVCPVVLGSGKKLFDRAPARPLSLLDVNRMDRGAVLLRYGLQAKG